MKQVHLTNSDRKMIAEAGQYLSNNLDKRITIAQLAGIMRISEKKLKAGFLDAWGTGVHGYLINCRMEKIKQLLIADEPLKAIAISTGYTHKNALINAFRQQYGVSPAIWKKQEEGKRL